MNEQITNVIDKIISRIDALEHLLDRNKLVESTAEIHCGCQSEVLEEVLRTRSARRYPKMLIE